MKLDTVAIHIYAIYLFLIYFVHIAFFLGIFASIPNYIHYWKIGVQLFLCLFLMIRFHPFRETYQLKPVDILFIFGSSFILFTNILLVESIKIPHIGKKLNYFIQSFGIQTDNPNIQLKVGNTISFSNNI
jgi:hypothetical protein